MPHSTLIEVQFQHDPNFYGRLLAEVFLYLYRHPPAPRWQALVIYPDRRTESEAGPSYQPFLEMGWVQRVYLAELDPAPNAFGLQVLKLIVEPESQAPEQAQRLWQAIQTELIPAVEKGHWLELISAILAEKLRNLTWEEIQAMLIIPEPFKETRFYQDLVAIGRQEGIQQGIQQGIETELRLIVQRLHRKGQTPAQIAELLEIPLEQVEQFLQDATS
jgi:predicted transposase/invertase (TIGR01784 family)